MLYLEELLVIAGINLYLPLDLIIFKKPGILYNVVTQKFSASARTDLLQGARMLAKLNMLLESLTC